MYDAESLHTKTTDPMRGLVVAWRHALIALPAVVACTPNGCLRWARRKKQPFDKEWVEKMTISAESTLSLVLHKLLELVPRTEDLVCRLASSEREVDPRPRRLKQVQISFRCSCL